MKRLGVHRPVVVIAAVVVAATMAVTGTAIASGGTSGQQLTGCLGGGTLSHLAIGTSPTRACPAHTRRISWSEEGPVGSPGITGLRGATGAMGPAGSTGSAGQKGNTGAPGSPAGSDLTGQLNGVSFGGTEIDYGAPVGVSTANTTNGLLATLTPDATVTPGNLSVLLSSPVPVGGFLEFGLASAKSVPSFLLVCSIPVGSTACTSTTATVGSLPEGTPIQMLALGTFSASLWSGTIYFGDQLTS